MGGETARRSEELKLELSVPCDERFAELLRAVSRRLAVYIGYADADAAAVAETVMQATAGLLGGSGPGDYTCLDLTFTTRGRELEIMLRYRRGDTSGRSGRTDIQQRLRRAGAAGAPVEAMRRVMSGVEFGRGDGVEFCRLIKRLPDAAV